MNGNGLQVEEGNFTRIHNTILDRLAKADLNGSEFRCLMYLFRQTYGYKKKEDKLSMGQWHEGTGLDKRQTIRTLKGLEDKKYIYAIDNGNNRTKTYGFNKYFWEEQASGESTTSEAVESGGETPITLEPTSGEPTTSLPQTSGETVTKLVVSSPPTKERKKTTITTSLPTGKGMAQKPSPKPPTEQQQWFGAVVKLVYGHEDFTLLSKKDRTAVGDAVADIRKSPEGYTLDHLWEWYHTKWCQEWPGKQLDKPEIQRPTLKQIKTGIGRVLVHTTVHLNGHGPPTTKTQVEFDLSGVL